MHTALRHVDDSFSMREKSSLSLPFPQTLLIAKNVVLPKHSAHVLYVEEKGLQFVQRK